MLLTKQKEQVRMRIEAGQNEKQLLKEYRPVFHTLEEWLVELKSTKTFSEQDAEQGGSGENFLSDRTWEHLKGLFEEKRISLEEQMNETLLLLEHAFDFMELCFGESQEMVVFITELSCSPHAMWFLGENECSRYYRYNKALLFEDREEQVRKKLGEIRGRMQGE
jgi:hypothetical protein